MNARLLLCALLTFTFTAFANEPAFTDFIVRKPSSITREACGSPIACSFLAATAACACGRDVLTGLVFAKATLRVHGTIYYFNGPFASLRKRAKDKSVVDAESAVQHEYEAHIKPAAASVEIETLLMDLERTQFASNEECVSAGNDASQAVSRAFRQELLRTQQRELAF